MSRFYDNEPMPAELRRKFDVYERIKKAGISLGTFDGDGVVAEFFVLEDATDRDC